MWKRRLFWILETRIIILITCYAYLIQFTKYPKTFPRNHVITRPIFYAIYQKMNFCSNFQNETLRESRIFYHFSSLIMQCQKSFHNFQMIISWLPISKSECDLGGILRSSCFYFIFYLSPNFENYDS